MYTLSITYSNNLTNKSSSLTLCFSDGSCQVVDVKSEANAKEHMEKLEALCPQAIFGYTDELGKMFATDLKGFLNLRYNTAHAADSNFNNFKL